MDLAVFNLANAATFDSSPEDERTSLVACFILVFSELLRTGGYSLWRARFSADL